jgi:hypothetical protein
MSCVRQCCYLIHRGSTFLLEFIRAIVSSKFLSALAHRFWIWVCNFKVRNLFRWREFFANLSILFDVNDLLCLIVCRKLSSSLLLGLWSNRFESRLPIWTWLRLFKATCILPFMLGKLTHPHLGSKMWYLVHGHLWVGRLIWITAKARISFALSKIMINWSVRHDNKWRCDVLRLVLLIEARFRHFRRWWREAVFVVINRYLGFSDLSDIGWSKYSLAHTVGQSLLSLMLDQF